MPIYLIVLNIMAFISYGVDKLKSIRKKNRIPEKTLFLWGLLGGPLGSILGMYVFHHKTKKFYFHLINYLFLLIWIFIVWKVVRL